MAQPQPIYRQDYRAPDYWIDQVELRFELGEEYTEVQARLNLRRNAAVNDGHQPLVLNGQDMELHALRLNGRTVSADTYQIDDRQLTLPAVPDHCTLDITTRLRPQDNTALEGLYQSSGNFCTQCEAEGFRRMTYFLDRPDVMAVYRVTIVADQARYPVLLSNGNLVDSGRFDDGRHWASWYDPFPKPSYLFALVAGNLSHIEDRFTTRSGREVVLRVYSESQHVDQCEHAMHSLKKAMRWDEQRFGREYDLDIYNIVAVGDFNMGAMENKGLNVFNTKYVLAKPDTATDSDYQHIEGVIAHEYFHNWTGNRVTCRDWFQLSLKEGLTVFRDQEFSSDMGSRGVKRINDVALLRAVQFPQDTSPMAHPVRPDSYIEINNFYTVTVYEKGAEIIRMLHQLLGEAGFRHGLDLYFERHDGQAVTCDDFVSALADANDLDLEQFRLWYSQAGTPTVTVTDDYDSVRQCYTLTVQQHTPPASGQSDKLPLHVPLALGLLGEAGQELPLQLAGENAPAPEGTRVLELREAEQRFTFVNVPERPIPSLLRGFSAPVKLNYDYQDRDLRFLLAHDSDAFNRWEAGQQLAIRAILGLVDDYRQGRELQQPTALADVFGQVLTDARADPALRALALSLPSESYLGEQMATVDVDGIHAARTHLRQSLAQHLRSELQTTYEEHQDHGPYRLDGAAIGRRSLKNRCLDYLVATADADGYALAERQYREAHNMTDQLAALQALAHSDATVRAQVLTDFYQRWQHDPLVVDKWFTLQATAPGPDTLMQVTELLDHAAFNLKNPNKVRALLGAFSHNPTAFHAAAGSGYAFVADHVIKLNLINPQVAARLLGVFSRWARYDRSRQELMRSQLKRILKQPRLSPDVYEIAAKSVDG